MQPLADLSALQSGALLQSGIVLAGEPVDAPLWVDGRNVEFRDNEVQKALGSEIFATMGGDVLALAQANVAGVPRVYAGIANTIWQVVNGALTNLGAIPTAESLQLLPWGSWLLVNDRKNPVKVWKNSGSVTALSGTTFTRAKVLHRWSPYVLAGNTSNGENIVEWCSDDSIETWSPDTTNTARNLVLRDLDSGIQAMSDLGSSIGVYSKNSFQALSYIGGDYVFGKAPALKGIGAVGPEAVVARGGENFGISHDGLWKTDGASITYIDPYDFGKWLRQHLNYSAAETVKSVNLRDQVRFALPIDGAAQPNIVVSYNTNSGAISYYDEVPTAMAPKDVLDYPLFAFGPQLCLGEKTVGGALGYVQTKPLDCGNQEVWKILQAVRLNYTGNLGLQVGIQETLDSPIEWIYDSFAERMNNLIDRQGVFITLRFDGTSDWTLSGFKLLGELGGYVV